MALRSPSNQVTGFASSPPSDTFPAFSKNLCYLPVSSHPSFKLTTPNHYLALAWNIVQEARNDGQAGLKNRKPQATGFYAQLKGLFLDKTNYSPYFLSRYSFFVNPQFRPYVTLATCRKRLWQKAHLQSNTRCAVCLSGKPVFFVGKACIFWCGEFPDNNVYICREASHEVYFGIWRRPSGGGVSGWEARFFRRG